jgi:hypothetical protein
MTHTPGPWEAVLADDPRGQPVPYYRGLVALVENRLSVVAKCGYAPKEHWEANASLIAAAPDMLTALIKAKAHIAREEDADDMAECLEAIEEAIAKATNAG